MVSLNLLNQKDLIELKKNNGVLSSAKKSAAPSTGPRAAPDPKLYIILTFDGEFEKVHYPLPLTYQEEPDLNSMVKTF